MISMGFKEDLETILSASSQEQRHIWLFSATMGPDVRKVADKFLKEPRYVQVNRNEVLSSTVEQVFYAVRESNKLDILCKIVDFAENFYGIVFCQTKNLVADVTRCLTERGYKVDCLHGDKDQRSREHTINRFRNKQVSILVCTDVASRGLDVKDVSHVINYSIPRELESYVHRIGRTARSGKKGIAMSLVTPNQRYIVGQLEKITKSSIKEGILPSRKDIGVKKVTAVLENFKRQGDFGRALSLLGEDWKSTLKGMTSEEVASRFLSMSFADLFEDKEREKLNLGARPPKDHKERNRLKEKTAPWLRNKYSSPKKSRFHSHRPK
jgi:ATP-dependent RNA helicase DeaD